MIASVIALKTSNEIYNDQIKITGDEAVKFQLREMKKKAAIKLLNAFGVQRHGINSEMDWQYMSSAEFSKLLDSRL